MTNYRNEMLTQGTAVRISNLPHDNNLLGRVGRVIGVSSMAPVKHYIVQMDGLMDNGYSALSITEACLDVL